VACQGVAEAPGPASVPPPVDTTGATPAEAAEATAELVSDAGVAAHEVSLVTVEETPAGPEITATSVASIDEAAAVASDAAVDGDLVAVEIDAPVQALGATPDPRRAEQWALDKTSFESAWTTETGTGQVVAVVDTGVRANHADLSGRVLSGWEFLHSRDGTAFSRAGGTTDGNGHGTHVAGIVAAVAGNGVGVSGAAPGVQILPVTVLCANGSGSDSDVANGITWAADHGADVINLSLGSTSSSSAMRTAVQYARSLGVVVVAASGNGGPQGAANYPGAISEVIAVGATTNTTANTLATYSTSGAYVDLAAPGGAGGRTGSSATEILSTWNDGGYHAISGTSMATPHVAAAAALVRVAHPTFTPTEVCTQLVRTADDLGTAGFDTSYGYGLVDPAGAVGATVATGPGPCP